MTQSNKILLKTLFKIEFELTKIQKILDCNNSFLSIQIDFRHIYDLFEVIISTFNIPETNYDSLYNILDNFCNSELSVDETISSIQYLIK